MGIAALVIMAIGAAISAYGQYRQGSEAQRQANREAYEKERQANVAQQQSEIAQIQGEEQEKKRSREYAQQVGSVYANAAGNGLLVDSSGSAAAAGDTVGAAVRGTANNAADDLGDLKANKLMSIWGYQQDKTNLLASARNERKYGKAAYRGGLMSAAGTLFTGVGSALAMGSSNGTFGAARRTSTGAVSQQTV